MVTTALGMFVEETELTYGEAVAVIKAGNNIYKKQRGERNGGIAKVIGSVIWLGALCALIVEFMSKRV